MIISRSNSPTTDLATFYVFSILSYLVENLNSFLACIHRVNFTMVKPLVLGKGVYVVIDVHQVFSLKPNTY